MQIRMVIMPSEDGLNVILWSKWVAGSIRTRHFVDRAEMINTLRNLGLITDQDGLALESFMFTDSCPLFSADVEENVLDAHQFILS